MLVIKITCVREISALARNITINTISSVLAVKSDSSKCCSSKTLKLK